MISAADRARAADLLARFRAEGAVPVEAAILQPAGTLLDLYGEDIRARAFVTHDPLRGEAMLRPDFTVPVVQAHMANRGAGGAEPATYCYAGEVFRRQEADDGRPREYLQVGFELFDGSDPPAADARVLALFLDALAPWGPQAATGDLGLVSAAVASLDTTERRRAALRRHLWRPARFRALLDRFGTDRSGERDRLAGLSVEGLAPHGARTPEEVAERIEALRADAEAPPIHPAQRAAVEALLSHRGPMAEAGRLRRLAGDLPALAPALDRLDARIDAMRGAGIAAPFAPAEGRARMEYYDGFTFGIEAGGRPVATGGRYDALTAALGGGRAIPAVGGVARPDLLGEAVA